MKSFLERPNRFAVFLMALACGIFCIALLSTLLPADSMMGRVFLGLNGKRFPFTIQNLLTLLVLAGLGEIFVRWRSSVLERSYVELGLLPEGESMILQQRDLSGYNLKLKGYLRHSEGFLIHMIHRCILQFQSSQSIDQASRMLETLTEIYAHRIDLKYAQLRYIAWAIPTFGFIGTVLGIGGALQAMAGSESGSEETMAETMTLLGYAFDTTFLALTYSAILVFFIHVIQAKEERSLSEASEYCLTNLINRLYVRRTGDGNG